MITFYRELYYYFGYKIKQCQLCNKNVNISFETHIIAFCPILDTLRQKFWSNATHTFSKVGQEINTFHNQLYMQHIINLFHNVNNNKNIFWSIICGMNLYNNNTKQFEYKYNNYNITDKKYLFLNNVILLIHK